ncbi:MAG TPA: hypothetical protein PKA06_05725, partial [Gemmatales bacterium]|nr:hypothetical protein [Gemmatales bacterium]
WSREQAAILEDCTRLAGDRSLGIMARGPALGGDTAGLLIDVDSFACSWIQTSLQHRTGNLQVEKTRCLPELAISIWSERIGTFIASKCLMESRRDPRVNGATDQQLFEQIEMRLSDWASQYDATLHIQQHHWQEELVIRASDVTQLCLPLAEQLCRNLPAPGELNALYLSHEAGRLPGLAQALYRQGSHQQVVTILPEDTHVKNLHVWIQRIEQGLHPVLKLTDPFPTGEATPENRADTLPFPKRK